MKIFVGVTDNNWYNYLANIQPDKVQERPSIELLRWHNENVFMA